MKKRLLAGFLTAVMLVMLCPVTVLAGGGGVLYLDEEGNAQNYEEDWTAINDSNAPTDWASGWYVVNSDVTVGSRITVSGDVHLILADGCKLTAESGVNVGGGNSLTIYAQSMGEDAGQLSAKGGEDQAGIGGKDGEAGGTITINGGRITANGGSSVWNKGGAGIGGGNGGHSGTIVINGGVVTAHGDSGGAGIGGGRKAGVGSITINGGTVDAFGSGSSAGIGGGSAGSGRNIRIHGGHVTAHGDSYGAGIGGGGNNSGGAGSGEVQITGGTVIAMGGSAYQGGGAGIGGGGVNANFEASGADGAVSISGESTVVIAASMNAATPSIGGGNRGPYGAPSSNVTRTNGLIVEGGAGRVYGSVTLPESFTVSAGTTLTIPEGSSLTIPAGMTLTNNGSIVNEGGLVNQGTVIDDGQITGELGGTIQKHELELGDLAFPTVEAGAAWPGPARLTIRETGGADATITKWEVSGTRFALTEGNKTIPANGTDQTWKLQPVEGLPAGSYSATVTLTYNNGKTAAAQVSITIKGSPVAYLDAEGRGGIISDYAAVVSDQQAWIEGWYVVDGDAAIPGRITVSGSVHLILKDGSTLTAPKGVGVDEGNSLTIYCQSGGTGKLIAGSDNNENAAIGGGATSNAGSITINGGVIEAASQGDGAGIGGGHANDGQGRQYGKFQSITINGGKVTARSGRNGAGIGCGCWAKGMGPIQINGGEVHASTAARDGRAYDIGWAHRDSDFEGTVSITGGAVFTEGSHGRGVGAANAMKSDCVIFGKNAGQAYGSAKLEISCQVPQGTIFTVPEGASLTIPDGVTFTNNGTILQYGTINGRVEGTQPIKDHSETTVTLSPDTVRFGESVTITAAIAKAASGARSLSAGLDQVNFYVGAGDAPALLGTVAAVGNTAAYTLQARDWNRFGVGENIITAVFGNNTAQGLLGSKGTAVLTVIATEFDGTIDLRHGSVTITKAGNGSIQIRQDGRETRVIDAEDSLVITSGGEETPNTITVEDAEVKLILSDVRQGGGDGWTCPLSLRNGANVSLTLQGENALAASGRASEGIEVWESCSLTINGPGTLNIGGEGTYVGIGIGGFEDPGSVTINGGTLNITAADVGIGARDVFGHEKKPAVIINGGVVRTNVSYGYGVGIGTQEAWCGGMDIAINGGTVELEGQGNKISANGEHPSPSENSGSVTITGGSIRAGDISPAPTDRSGAPIHAVTVETGRSGAEVGDMALSGTEYGSPAQTDREGNLTLYLPAGDYTGSAIVGGEVVKLVGVKSEAPSEGGTPQAGTVTATGVHVTTPAGTRPAIDPDGTVSLPGGSTVKAGDGPEIAVGDKGGIVNNDGGVTVEGGGSVQVGGATITLPSGGTIKPDPDGTIPIPGGATVEKDGTTITLPTAGGAYDPGTGTVTKNSHTVTFDSQGGSEVPAVSVIHGGKLTRPDDPSKSGHAFGGWYKERGCATAWQFETYTVTADVTLYALWTKNGGDAPDTPENPDTPDPPDPPDPPSSSGGGSNVPSTYRPTVAQPKEGGTVSVSPAAPRKGDAVTLTPRPDEGFVVDKIVVTDRNGKEVEVTANPDGTYSFVQPSGRVKIEVSYTESRKPAPCDGGSACGSHGLSDVGGVDVWYHDAVDYVLKNGLMNGYGDGRLGPNDDLSRAQLAQILYNREGRPAVSGGSGFADAPTGAWYADAVAWASGKGIVTGYGGGAFGPNDPITREQLAVMLWRYAGRPAAPDLLLTFTDADKAGGYAQDAIRWAVERGVITGKAGNILDPEGKASRAEVATMLMRYLESKK